MTEKKDKQPNLFGDTDAVFNALETEITIVNDELADQGKKIDRAEKTIEILGERKEKLVEARDIVAKTRKKTKTKNI